MHPFERKQPRPIPVIKPSLQLLLKDGWHWDAAKKSFLSPDGEQISLKGVLPRQTKFVSLISSLVAVDSDAMSDEERYLARNYQVIFSHAEEPAEYADALRRLEAVEEVRIPPQIALP
jgi:hypothetical protein